MKLSSLSYLQSKILEEIYLSINLQEKISKKNLSDKIYYDEESKIFLGAVESLKKKEILIGDFNKGFKIPKKCHFINEIIKVKNLKKKLKYLSIFEIHKNYKEQINGKSDFNDCVKKIDGWYSYIEEFSAELILKKIKLENMNKKSIIYDPFIGSGTTAIAANVSGFEAIGMDVNPLMTLVSSVKTNWKINLKKITKHLKVINSQFLKNIKKRNNKNSYSNGFSNIPLKELDQWLSLKNQKEIFTLKNILKKIEEKEIRNFFLVCMAKAAFDTSHVALCPGTTFYPFRIKNNFWNEFGKKVFNKINQLDYVQKKIKTKNSKFFNDTCLNVKKYLKKSSIDLAITSPPYPNDLEYTRQTRLELYLLDLVGSMDDVSKIKKKMVKSSTKLIYKESNSSKFISKEKIIIDISSKIFEKTKDKNWGWDYPRMVKEYFGDMYLCLRETKNILKKNAKFILVCGDQTVQGVYIPVCDILIKMAKNIGYQSAIKEKYRVRRSTTHKMSLPEDIIILKK